jgi:hypothetical protein
MKVNYELISGILCIIVGLIGLHCYLSSKETINCGSLSWGIQNSYDWRRKEILYISVSILVLGIGQLIMKFFIQK